MQFGLINAPATFQRTMNNILSDCREFSNVYIDDIVVFSLTLEKHVEHVRKVFEEKLFAKKKKRTFSVNKIRFCGFLLTREGVSSHQDKLRAVKE